MEITVSTQDGIAIVAPSGVIDTRGSLTFETTLLEVLANTRRIVIDLQKVDLITSACLRVLVMMGKRLGGDGTLLLCGLSAPVKCVFDIAGFTSYFGIKTTVAEAIAALAAAKPSRAATAGPSRVSRLTMRLLGDGNELAIPAAPAADEARPPSRLTAQVTAILKDVR